MEPVSPVTTEEFKDYETVYAKDQPEYNPLPAIRTSDGTVLTRWRPTEQERQAIAEGADILLTILTFNQPLQPLMMEVPMSSADLVGILTRMGVL